MTSVSSALIFTDLDVLTGAQSPSGISQFNLHKTICVCAPATPDCLNTASVFI